MQKVIIKKNCQKLILITHECSPKMEHQTFRKVLWSLEDIRRVSIRCEAWDDTISREAMHHGKRKGKQKGSQPLIKRNWERDIRVCFSRSEHIVGPPTQFARGVSAASEERFTWATGTDFQELWRWQWRYLCLLMTQRQWSTFYCSFLDRVSVACTVLNQKWTGNISLNGQLFTVTPCGEKR